MKQRIIRIARKAFKDESRALEELRWYDYAGRFCAGLDLDHDLPSGTSAGVVAALSPLQSWESQVKYTPAVIVAGLAGERIPGAGWFANKDKAARILQGEAPLDVLGGDKVRSFYRNLTGDWSAVTIDRHAVNIAGWTGAKHDNRSNNPHYATIATAFRQAAKTLGLAPAEIQALTWCFWRNPW
jgi:hypothetical protein